jgi:hypothetical protein
MITRTAARSVLQGTPSFRIVHCKSSRLNAVGNRWRCAGFHLARRTSLLRARLEDELEVRLGRLVDAGLDHVRARGRPVLSDATDSIIKQRSKCGLRLFGTVQNTIRWPVPPWAGALRRHAVSAQQHSLARPGCGRCWQSRHSPRRRSHEPMRILQRATCKTRRATMHRTTCRMQQQSLRSEVRQ